MIPRSKVNYSFIDLFNLSFIRPEKYYIKKVMHFLQNFFSQKNILLTQSGRGGLYYILKSLPQKNVFIPAYTCNAVVEAISHAGKNCDYIEVNEEGFNVNIDSLKKNISANSIFIATHQFGFPTEIKKIKEICIEKNCILIEDCAGSFGTRISDKLTGTFGDFSFFSFDSTKLINAPLKSGFVIAKDNADYQKLKTVFLKETDAMPLSKKALLFFQAAIYTLISSSNLLYKLFHILFFKTRNIVTTETNNIALQLSGFYKYKITGWQAAIILKQLNNLEDIFIKRKKLYNLYQEKIINNKIKLPPCLPDNNWICIRFPILVDNKIEIYKKLVKTMLIQHLVFQILQLRKSTGWHTNMPHKF